jgi:hypothetical protein
MYRKCPNVFWNMLGNALVWAKMWWEMHLRLLETVWVTRKGYGDFFGKNKYWTLSKSCQVSEWMDILIRWLAWFCQRSISLGPASPRSRSLLIPFSLVDIWKLVHSPVFFSYLGALPTHLRLWVQSSKSIGDFVVNAGRAVQSFFRDAQIKLEIRWGASLAVSPDVPAWG